MSVQGLSLFEERCVLIEQPLAKKKDPEFAGVSLVWQALRAAKGIASAAHAFTYYSSGVCLVSFLNFK
jgi:hypothetical protein